MNTIFVNTPDGILKAKVEYNPLWKMHQLYIDGSLYGEFKPNKESVAIEHMYNSFLPENIIKPDCVLLIDEQNPLSNQVKKITGDNYNTTDFEDLYKSTLIRHRKTGLIIRTISHNAIKEHFKDYPFEKITKTPTKNDT